MSTLQLDQRRFWKAFHGRFIRRSGGLESAFSLCFEVLYVGLESASSLGFGNLIHGVNAGAQRSRAQLLAILADHLGGGDMDWAALAKKDEPPEDGIALLAQDPLFEMAWYEMEEDNKQEFGDIKKAMTKQRCKTHASCKKRKLRAKAKAVAKAKAAPLFAPPPIPAVEAEPPQDAHPMPAPPAPRGHYEYVSFGGGHIAFSEILRKINAHCLHPDHQTNKCHLVWRAFHGSLIRRNVRLELAFSLRRNVRLELAFSFGFGVLYVGLESAFSFGFGVLYMVLTSRPPEEL